MAAEPCPLSRMAERRRTPGASAPDPNDRHLWDLLAARPEAILVTGDRKLLQDPPAGVSVLSPRGFVELANPR